MKYCLLILTILIFSCNSEPNYDDYLKQMDIVLTDNYKVLGQNTDGAMGDFIVDFQLKISDKDFENIIAKIKLNENYREYKSGESPNSFSSIGKNYHITGFKLAGRYFYKKESNSEPIYYELVVDSNKTLNFTYAED
jgi:hypothetical protein